MRKRDVLIGAALGSAAGLIAAPLVQLAIRPLFGAVHAPQVFAGSLVATAFFLVSAVVAAFYQNSPNLRGAMLIAYMAKTAIVFVALQGVTLDKSDAYAFGISVTVSAVAYLLFQTLYIAKWRRRYRHRMLSMTGNR